MSLSSARRRVLLPAFLVALLALLFGGSPAHGWYDKVHMYVIQQALNLISRVENGPTGPYGELLAETFALAMGKGGSDEDWGAVRENERSFRHYYNPDGPGPEGQTGVRFYNHYWLWTVADGSAVKRPDEGYYEGAMGWATQSSAVTGNLDGWQPAIDSYSDTDASRWVAYYRLGHVGHLLGDMAETEHTKVFPHPGSGLVMPDKLWSTAKFPEYTRIDGVLASGPADVSETQAQALWSLRIALKLAWRVLQDTTPDPAALVDASRTRRTTGYEGLIEDQVHPDLVRKNLPPDVFAKRLKPMLTSTRPAVPFAGRKAPVRLPDVREYFDTLARRGNQEAAARGMDMPFGLADLQPFLERNAPLYVQGLSDYTMAYAHFKGEPMFGIPLIGIEDEAAKSPFYGLAFTMLAEATEYVAGAFELFHDIVSPPPFVKSVAVDQGGSRVYEAAWKDSTERRVIEPQLIGPLAASGAHDIVTGRELVRSANGTLDADRPATVTIRFGPSGGDSSLVRSGVDPQSIQVSVGAAAAQGAMVGPDTWRGVFIPRAVQGQARSSQPIGVAAVDTRRHYARKGLPERAYRLDANPETAARPETEAPYAWTGYEPGADRNHAVRVRRAETPPTTAVEPPARLAPRQPVPRNCTFTGDLDAGRVQGIVARYTQIPVRIQSTSIQGRVVDGYAEFGGPVVFESWETNAAINQQIRNKKTYTYKRSACDVDRLCDGGVEVVYEWFTNGQPTQTRKADLVWRISLKRDTGQYLLTVANGRPPSWGDIPYILNVTEVR
jgi:hypothetical protein